MSVIFQLFCAEDLQKLTYDQLQELRSTVRQSLQKHTTGQEHGDHRPSLCLGIIDKTTPPPDAPEPIHEALNKRFYEVSHQLKSPQLYSSRPPFNFQTLLDQRNADVTQKKEDMILAWAISCEVNNYEFYNTLARVRNDAYSFFLNNTGQQPKGPDTLYSPFNPLHPLYNLFYGRSNPEAPDPYP